MLINKRTTVYATRNLLNILRNMNNSDYCIGGKQITTKNPIELFNIWLEEAKHNTHIKHAAAMNLATVSKSGVPSARMVLLTQATEDGFSFCTNLCSKKSKELKDNPHACLTFYWDPLGKQIKINGIVERMSNEESEEKFRQRPVELKLNIVNSIELQLGAAASSQTATVIANRKVMLDKYDEVKERYKGKDIPKPDHWGGFLLKPTSIEFYQLREFYLDDRIRFRRREDNEAIDATLTHQAHDTWLYERLAI